MDHNYKNSVYVTADDLEGRNVLQEVVNGEKKWYTDPELESLHHDYILKVEFNSEGFPTEFYNYLTSKGLEVNACYIIPEVGLAGEWYNGEHILVDNIYEAATYEHRELTDTEHRVLDEFSKTIYEEMNKN